MTESTTMQIERCLVRLGRGEEAARHELLNRSGQRLLRLIRKIFPDYAELRRWEDSDDVLQGAYVRLCRALEHVTPSSARDFFRLASQHIRWELLDLARSYFGPQGRAPRRRPADSVADDSLSADSSLNPERMEMWTAFHEQIAALPEEEREVVDLLWYQGLSQAEAAELLSVSDRTIKRRWQSARLRLHAAMHGESLL
jgi:RNA polymerase sigma factor (sigma-70 family)